MASAEGQQIDTLPSQMYGWDGTKPVKIVVGTDGSIAINALSGASNSGAVSLASANTWYAVPSTVPTSPYALVVSIETASGTIRWSFASGTTPSSDFGNQAPYQLTVNLGSGEVVYFSSTTAADKVTWTTKEI